MALYVKKNKSLENLSVSNNIKLHNPKQKPDGLKFLLDTLYEIRFQIRKLDISGNLGMNAPGTLESF